MPRLPNTFNLWGVIARVRTMSALASIRITTPWMNASSSPPAILGSMYILRRVFGDVLHNDLTVIFRTLHKVQDQKTPAGNLKIWLHILANHILNIYTFFYNGCMGIIKHRIKNDFRESPTEIAAIGSKSFRSSSEKYYGYLGDLLSKHPSSLYK
jgi:hypothetical protein